MKRLLIIIFYLLLISKDALCQYNFVIDDAANISKDKLAMLKVLSQTFYNSTNHNIHIITTVDPVSYKYYSETDQRSSFNKTDTDVSENLNKDNIIYFLFDMKNGNTRMEFLIKIVSNKLLPKVEKYITDKLYYKYGLSSVTIDKSIPLGTNTCYEIISEYIRLSSIAMDPKWSQRLKTHASSMALDERYYRGHCYDIFCEYYEFEPYELTTVSLSDAKYIYGFDAVKKYNDRTVSIVSLLNNTYNFHSTLKLSDWPQLTTKKWDPDISQIEKFSSHAINLELCRYKMKSEFIEQGLELPVMAWYQIHGWRATYCNFFAQDLSKSVFSQIPWGTHKSANEIFSYMPTNIDFISISWVDAWKYINAGYIAYFVSSSSGHGHIATGYPTTYLKDFEFNGIKCQVGTIAQAGDDYLTDIFYLGDKKPWSLNNLKNVNIYVYLGYIK